MSDLRHFTNEEISGLLSRLRDLLIGGCDEEISLSRRETLLEYTVEALKRVSNRRFASLMLSRDIDHILAELAKEGKIHE